MQISLTFRHFLQTTEDNDINSKFIIIKEFIQICSDVVFDPKNEMLHCVLVSLLLLVFFLSLDIYTPSFQGSRVTMDLPTQLSSIKMKVNKKNPYDSCHFRMLSSHWHLPLPLATQVIYHLVLSRMHPRWVGVALCNHYLHCCI